MEIDAILDQQNKTKNRSEYAGVCTQSEDETVALARQFADALKAGDVVALHGDLGTGKTRFTKGICDALNVHSHVSSPTFTILHEYIDGKLPVYHFDFYRLSSLDELNEIGFDEYIYGEGICVVEWADRVEERLPEKRYDVRLELGDSHYQRLISIVERS